MARKVLFVAILVVGIIATFGEFLLFDPVDDIADDFWTPLQYFRRQAKQITKRYSIGNRVNYDKLLELQSGNYTWASLVNVTAFVKYPENRPASRAKLTYVEVQVNQTSPIGRAFLNQGAIGKNLMNITIQANLTTAFNYTVKFYGK